MSSAEDTSFRSALPSPQVIITSHNADGKAIVHSTSPAEPVGYPTHQATLSLVYTTSSMPVDLNKEVDIKEHEKIAASGKISLVKAGGTVARFVDFAPGNTAMMHRTQSLDYGVVMEGSMILELDDGTRTLMKRGDVVVQRATNHGWKNASETEWARMFFVLQECKPLTVGEQEIKEDLTSGKGDFPSSW